MSHDTIIAELTPLQAYEADLHRLLQGPEPTGTRFTVQVTCHPHRGMCGYIHSSDRICAVGIKAGSGQTAVITGFVGQHAPHVLLASVPVGLPSVGPVEAVGSVVAGVDPQDGFGESLAA